MSADKRLNLLEHAKKLTGATEMSTLIQAASELESFLNKPFETLIKQVNDFNEFLPNCLIRHPVKGVIPFNPKPHQKLIATALQTSTFTMLLSARQMGSSLTCAAFALWEATSKANQTIVIASNNFTTAAENLDNIRFMIQHSTAWLPKLIVNNKASIEFDNGSKIIVQAVNENMCRGMSISTLIIDNCAYIPHRYDTWVHNLWPTISAGKSKVVLASCAGYTGGFFYKMWSDPIGWPGTRITIDYTWRDDHLTVEQQMKSYMSQEQFDREYRCKFTTKQ